MTTMMLEKYIDEGNWNKVASEINDLSGGHVVSTVKDDCDFCGEVIRCRPISVVDRNQVCEVYHEKCYHEKYPNAGKPYRC